MDTIMNNKNTRGLVYGVLGLLIIYLFSASYVNFKQAGFITNPNTLPVYGKGEVVAKPDVATFSFTVNEKGLKGEDAQAAMSKVADPLVKALKDAGIADADIQTSSYALNPTYDYTKQGVCNFQYCPPSNPVINGYEASESFTVKVRDLTKTGDLLSMVSSKGAQNVSSIALSVDDSSKLKSEARKKAIDDAKQQAEDIAKAAGLHLGSIVSISEDSSGGYQPYAMDAMKSSVGNESAPTVPVEAGSQKITSNVTILFEIR